MIEFAASAIVFFAAHAAPRATGLRDVAIRRVGVHAYLAFYSTASIASLAWLIAATLRAPYIALWPPSPWTAGVALAFMLPACLLFAMAATRPNPLSVAFATSEKSDAAPGVLALTRHPILWSFALWSSAHLVANGDVASVALFGAMAAFSIIGMILMDRRARRTLGADAWRRRIDGLRRAGLASLATPRCLIEAVGGSLLYAALLTAHEPAIGVDPLAWWR